jgi:nitrate reductase alpha subunit
MRQPSIENRKDKIELVLAQAQKVDGTEAIQAWRRLQRELGHMTHPEARMPRFKQLLHAVWIAASNDQT